MSKRPEATVRLHGCATLTGSFVGEHGGGADWLVRRWCLDGCGVESALKVLDSSLPINTLIGRASRDQQALNL
jgi:hypothetical protein